MKNTLSSSRLLSYHGAMEKPFDIHELLRKLQAQRGLLPAQDSLLDQLQQVRQVCEVEGVQGAEAQVAVAMGAYDAADYLAHGDRREMEVQRYLATKGGQERPGRRS